MVDLFQTHVDALNSDSGAPRMCDGNDHSWLGIPHGDQTILAMDGPVSFSSLTIKWHYGGAFDPNGDPSVPSGAAGPIAFDIGGSRTGPWTQFLYIADPAGDAGASYPGDFQLIKDVPTTIGQFIRIRSTSVNNNDIYTISAFGEEEPGTGTGIDIHDPEGVYLVTFTKARARIRSEYNLEGSGYLVINKNDPEATAVNLARGNFCRVTFPEIDPDAIFEFILQEGDFDLVSSDEEGGEMLQFGGPGNFAVLRDAVSYNVSFLGVTDSGPVPDPDIWKYGDDDPLTWGRILKRIIDEAQARTPPAIPGVTTTFTNDEDSLGNPWTSYGGTFEFATGSTLYDVAVGIVKNGGLRIRMDPGLVLNAYIDLGRDLTGAFAADTVRFEKGVNITGDLNRRPQGGEWASHLLVKGKNGYREVVIPTFPYRKEKFADLSNISDNALLDDIGQAILDQRDAAQEPVILAPTPTGKHREVNDPENGYYYPGPPGSANGKYWVGDLVTVHTGTGDADLNETTLRVYAITIEREENGQLAAPIVECNVPFPSDDPVDRSDSTTIIGSSTGSGSSSGGSTIGGGTSTTSTKASRVTYDNGTSGLTADDVQEAIDELAAEAGSSLPWFDVLQDYGPDASDLEDAMADAAAAGGGVVYLRKNEYAAGTSALQDTSRGNAQILVPSVNYVAGEQVTVHILGEVAPPPIFSVIGSTPLPDGHVIVSGALTSASGTSPSLFGGWGPDTAEDFTNINLIVENVAFRLPENPVYSALNLSHVAAVTLRNVVCDVSDYQIQGLTEPSTSASAGIILPGLNNGALTRLDVVNVAGYYTGYVAGEHTDGSDVAAWGCKIALKTVAGYHPIHFDRFMAVHCERVIQGTGGTAYLSIDQLNVEHAASGWWVTDFDVDDASNYLKGRVEWKVTLAGVGHDSTWTVNGAANLIQTEMGDSPGSFTPDYGEDADITTLDYDDVADAGVLDEIARADHRHGMPSAASGSGHGAILLASDHSVPFTFDEILQASDGSDFLYASE